MADRVCRFHGAGRWLLAGVVVCSAFAAAAEPTLKLDGTLLGLDGRPTSGTTVLLVGVDRMNMVRQDEAAQREHYRAVTDARGKFGFEFRPVRGHSVSGSQAPEAIPGFGSYYAVVSPAADGSHAGAVSARIFNYFEGGTPQIRKEYVPEFVLLRDAVTTCTLRLRKGIVFEGRIVNPDMQPMAGQSVTIAHDLHAGTHTGYGGEIFERRALTDTAGRFRFTNVYPAAISVGDETLRGWTRTRFGAEEPWIEDCVDVVPVADGKSALAIEIMASNENRFKVFGTVRDAAGQPIAGAEVSGALSSHRQARTHGDFHSYPGTITDAQGQYAVMLPTPWLRAVQARKEGYKSQSRGNWQDIIEPGQYDFTLPVATPTPAMP